MNMPKNSNIILKRYFLFFVGRVGAGDFLIKNIYPIS